jgi:heavy metal sensor kinase
MKWRSIGLRLTLWYAGSLAAVLVLLGGGLWLALRHSMYHAVDESLRDRVQGIRQFIEQEASWLTPDELSFEFQEHSVLGPGGDLFQVADIDGAWLYRSSPLYDEHVPIYDAAVLRDEPRVENIVVRDAPLRFLSQAVEAGGGTYVVQVAAPLHELEEGLTEFSWVVLIALPAVLLIASVGGYQVSRRALRPVDEITRMARSVSVGNLSGRLSVPESGDELQRLSETLNDMIARLESAFERITRFTADASHELRTPLALMRTTAELALDERDPAPNREEALAQILAEVERTSQLVDNLLWVARADSGAAPVVRTRMDLGRVVRETGMQVAPLAEARHQKLDTEVPDGPVIIDGDAAALRRLFLILLDNAVKYTLPGGRIEMRLEPTDREAAVSVRDTGIGIPAEDLPHVFERFYRVDKARSREQGGSGLGLAIGLWIAEQHEGSIAVESEPGSGTAFRVTLPRL